MSERRLWRSSMGCMLRKWYSCANYSTWRAASSFLSHSSMMKSIQELEVKKEKIMGSTKDKKLAFQKSFLQYAWHTNTIEGLDCSNERIRNTKAVLEFIRKSLKYLLITIFNTKYYVLNKFQVLVCDLRYSSTRFLSRFEGLNHKTIIKARNMICGLNHVHFRTEDVCIRRPNGDVAFPPEHERILQLMDQYVDFVNSMTSQRVNPLIESSLSKILLVEIHPFEDGNGRISRAIMNAILRNNGYPDICIPASEIETYYGVLSEYFDNRKMGSCFEYICKCINRSLDKFEEDLHF